MNAQVQGSRLVRRQALQRGSVRWRWSASRCGLVSQQGSASLIGLALCGFVVIAALVTVDIGALASARARAETAADLAAVAAVTPHAQGVLISARGAPGAGPGDLGSPDGRANVVATSNGAEVIACSCGPLETIISVRVPARLIPLGATVSVRAYARAVLPPQVNPSTGPLAGASPPRVPGR